MTSIPFTSLPTLVDWPRDEAAHDGLPWEIWWFSAILKADDRRLAAHVMFNHLADGSVYVSISLADLDRETVLASQILAVTPESAKVKYDSLNIETPSASAYGSFSQGYKLGIKFPDGTRLDLALKPTRPVLFNGGAGTYVFQGTTTTQYSIGSLTASGSMRLDNQNIEVTGHGWYDRQWDNSQRSNSLQFTWFGLCLSSGETISVFDTGTEGHRWATIAAPDATHIVTAVQISSEGSVRSPMGRNVPLAWNVTLSGQQTRLILKQRIVADTQLLYTGAIDLTGERNGSRVVGYGFYDAAGVIETS